jgi:hypothetical protein
VSSERRSRWCRNRNSPAASFTSHEPNDHLHAAGFDNPLLAFGVPVDALARLGRHMGLIGGWPMPLESPLITNDNSRRTSRANR